MRKYQVTTRPVADSTFTYATVYRGADVFAVAVGPSRAAAVRAAVEATRAERARRRVLLCEQEWLLACHGV